MSSSIPIGIKLTRAYDLYRNSPVGIAMFDAIHELLKSGKLTPQQALIVVTQFDYSIRKIMTTKYSKQNSFSFDAHVRGYRLYRDWCVISLEDVAFYQHFPPRMVQLYKNQKEQMSKKATKAKPVSNKEYQNFLKKAKINDVKVLIQQVPQLLLISKSSSIAFTSTGSCNDRRFGKCEKVEELKQFVHPRFSVYLLERREDPNDAAWNEIQKDKVDDNVLPTRILNRFKNSSMFSNFPKPQTEVEQYYNRKITLDPSFKKKFTYVNTFDNRKTHASSSKEKTEYQDLSHQVGELQKDLKSKDEEISNLKASLRNAKK